MIDYEIILDRCDLKFDDIKDISKTKLDIASEFLNNLDKLGDVLDELFENEKKGVENERVRTK